MASVEQLKQALLSETEEMAEVVPLIKASFYGSDGSEISNLTEGRGAAANMFADVKMIEPPLRLETLASLFEMSGALRTNVDSYSTNIDAFGHMFDPTIDLDDEDTEERVRAAIVEEAMSRADLGLDEKPGTGDEPIEDVEIPEPTEQEVRTRVAEIKKRMMRERSRLDRFFDHCTVDESFVALRTRTRQDLEVLGNAYWEVLRNGAGQPTQLVYVPAYTIRLVPRDGDTVSVPMRVRTTPISTTEEIVARRFRRFVQSVEGETRLVWFKELGDPRIISSRTGKTYATLAMLKRKEKDALPATELLHFKIHSARTPYGVPRWVSELVAVLGSRNAEEVNLMYFENRSVPPLAILVTGGRLNADTEKRLRDMIQNEIKGKRNFHKIMVLEADAATPGSAPNDARMKIEIKPLTSAQNSDAQFLRYVERNTDQIGSVFRLPKLLRGDSRDQNRATSQASLEMAEQQVFSPLRNEFDFVINRKILPLLDVTFWKFVSKGPSFSDPLEIGKMICLFSQWGILTPAECRELASVVFGRDFKAIDEDWVDLPMPMTLKGLLAGGPDLPDDGTDAEVDELEEDPDEVDGEDVAASAPVRPRARPDRGYWAVQARRMIQLADRFEIRASKRSAKLMRKLREIAAHDPIDEPADAAAD